MHGAGAGDLAAAAGPWRAALGYYLAPSRLVDRDGAVRCMTISAVPPRGSDHRIGDRQHLSSRSMAWPMN